VRGDLCGLGAAEPATSDGHDDLLAAETGGIKVLLRIAFDLRRAALAGLNLVTETAELVGEMGLIDSGREVLRLEKAALLKRPHLSILPLGHVEDDDVRVELRRGIAVHRASRVMLKLCGDKLPRLLGGAIPADTGLRVPLQLIQRDLHGLTVRLSHPVIAADKRRQRDGFWC
jgi:hypothetical protein